MVPKTPLELDEETERALLKSQWDEEPIVLLDCPPGAGKTRKAENVAVQSYALRSERVMFVTQTNDQVFDVARRISTRFKRHSFSLLIRDGLEVPSDIGQSPNLSIARKTSDLPQGPCVVIGNATKWSWVRDVAPFDLQIIDEAYQLPDYGFMLISDLARRKVKIGDPGQIWPVIPVEVERWRDDPAGPHVPSPRALRARHPEIRPLSLPVSRRLIEDTVKFVQPAFYSDLPFMAFSPPGERSLVASTRGIGSLDKLIDIAEGGGSVSMLQLSRMITGELDGELVDIIVSLARRLFERGVQIRAGRSLRPLEPGMVGVVCAHRSQVNAIQERLPPNLADIFVETSDRFQGLERAVMIVYHPLSGRADGSAFHMDAGRLCVMLSRHNTACFVVSRGGLDDMLRRYAPSGNRALGIDEDEEFRGWSSHIVVIEQLARANRIVGFSPSGRKAFTP